MKKLNVLIAVALILLCAAGWFSMVSQKVSENDAYEQYIADADSWAERGLYQRAIASYKKALAEEPTEELYEKAVRAYQARYKEAPEDTLDEYMEFLEEAVRDYPANQLCVDSLTEFYLQEESYKELYTCLAAAVENGYDTAPVHAKLLGARYHFTLRRNEYTGLKQTTDGDVFVAARNGGWNLYSTEDGYLMSSEHGYMSQCGKDEILVVTGEDSRLMKADGMVLGIFENIVTDAGIYAEGLVPASFGKTYAYYNEFAEEQFGGYEMAGMFQNGFAAVKQGSQWGLVDTAGEEASDAFDEIVLDHLGRYIVDDMILVKESDNSYALYDEVWKLKATLECSDADQYTADGLIAVCKNGKWGYMNAEGEMVIDPAYEQARSFSNGLAAVCKNGLWGFIDRENHLVINCQFANVGYMNANGICPVQINIPQAETEESAEESTDEETEQQESELWQLLKLTNGIIADQAE